MPLKSWAFKYDGHPVRAEIWWRFSGWNRKRLYIKHKAVVRRRGRFTATRPMTAPLADGGTKSIEVQFRPRRLGLDMDCDVSVDGERLSLEELQVHFEKKWQHSASRDGGRGVDYDDPGLGCLVLLILLFLLVSVWIPLILIVFSVVMIQIWMSKRRLRKHGRVLDWGVVEERCRSGPSTLIYNPENSSMVWWTQDDVLACSPLPLPDEQEMIYRHRNENAPFVEWCYHHHLSEQTGKALLVRLPQVEQRRFRFTDRGLDRERWNKEFPLLKIVLIATPSRKRLKASDTFCGYLGDSLIGSIPLLAEGIQNSDPTVRKLCMEAIALAGKAADGLVPLLSEKLYNGPWEDRFSAASTLTDLGPAGINAVAEAAKCEDPSIQRPAKSALAWHERSGGG